MRSLDSQVLQLGEHWEDSAEGSGALGAEFVATVPRGGLGE